MANWRPNSSNSSKSSNNWPKRQLSRELSSSDTNNNPSNGWFQSSFNNNNNNKRAKTDQCSGDVGSVTRGLNQLTTSSQQMGDDTDPFDDDLDEFLTQATFVPGQGFTQTQAMQSGPQTQSINIPTVPTAIGSINTQSIPNNVIHSDASEGRTKILESRNKQLTEEVAKLKAQILVANKKTGEMSSGYGNQLQQLKQKYESELTFMHSENKTQQQMIEQMQIILNKLGPNATLNSFVNMMNSRKNCPTFSQIKLQEFYSGLTPNTSGMATSSSHSSQMSTTGNLYVADSQQSHSSNTLINIPSQVGPTQFTQSPMSVSVPQSNPSSGPEAMDTSSAQSSQPTLKSHTTQSQLMRTFWESTKTKLEDNFNENTRLLEQLLLGQQIEVFDNQWLRNTQELDLLANTLNRLSSQKGLQIVTF